GGLAAYAGKMFRIGHMGNVDTHDLISSMAAIERTLYRMEIIKKEELGKGVAALMQGLVD
ncbi:MAG: aminotransferase, partial [Clostridia bacterium]|nr:aminotransferase [Clostridia bacterium]